MASSERRVVAFRPDEVEDEMIVWLSKKFGLPQARVLGQALRKWAQEEIAKETPHNHEAVSSSCN